MKPRVLVDVDGVLADFLGGALWIIKDITGQTFTPDDVVQWDVCKGLGLDRNVEATFDRACRVKGFALTLKAYSGSHEAISTLNEISDLFIVTAPVDSETWMHDRLQWLQREYGLRKNRVIYAHAKHVISGDFLIDDKPANVIDWHLEHRQGTAVLWHQPYNSGYNVGSLRTNDWNEIIDRVKKFDGS